MKNPLRRNKGDVTKLHAHMSMSVNKLKDNGIMVPKKYSWLLKEPGPKMLLEALKLYGVKEAPGKANNQIILDWAVEIGLPNYKDDEIPWCGLIMGVVAKRAGKPVPKDPLWALNWAKFGEKVSDGAQLGDTLVFRRPGGNHVGLYVGEDEEYFHVLGGNQKQQVNVIRIEKSRLRAIRRPAYKVKPSSVRRIVLSASGEISKNEN